MVPIALVGFIGSGKDTVANYLVDVHGYTQFAFADALKDVLVAIFGWDRDLLEGKSDASREWRNTVDEWWAKKINIPHLTPRWAMQHVGPLMRQYLDPQIWIATVERRLDHCQGPFLVSDGRYHNELDMARAKNAKIIRVRRGTDPQWFPIAVNASRGSEMAMDAMDDLDIHRSEWDWTGYAFDHVVENDGTLPDLYKKIERLL
jgi:hypothetical protein